MSLPAAGYLKDSSKWGTPLAFLLLNKRSFILLLHLTSTPRSTPFSNHLEHIHFCFGLGVQPVSFPSNLFVTYPFFPDLP